MQPVCQSTSFCDSKTTAYIALDCQHHCHDISVLNLSILLFSGIYFGSYVPHCLRTETAEFQILGAYVKLFTVHTRSFCSTLFKSTNPENNSSFILLHNLKATKCLDIYLEGYALIRRRVYWGGHVNPLINMLISILLLDMHPINGKYFSAMTHVLLSTFGATHTFSRGCNSP